MKFMIVDDNDGMREMIRSSACADDDIVLECPDGTVAVESYDRFRPDVVLMDIEMKQMDGFTAAEHIYSMDPHARIIFVSSHNTSAFRLKAKKLHSIGFVLKENLFELQTLIHH